MPQITRQRFPRNTIQEALCEVRFASSPDVGWNPSRPKPIYDRIGDSFPELEPVTEPEIEIAIGPQGPVHAIRPVTNKMRFYSENRKRLIQLSDRIFSYNIVGDYVDWDEMKTAILQNWATVVDVIKPLEVQKIGLRYINRIPANQAASRIADWLMPTKFIPSVVIESDAKFMCRIESQKTRNDLFVVTIGETVIDNQRALLFDLDVVRTEPVLRGIADISDTIESLHEELEEQFLGALTETYTENLKGK